MHTNLTLQIKTRKPNKGSLSESVWRLKCDKLLDIYLHIFAYILECRKLLENRSGIAKGVGCDAAAGAVPQGPDGTSPN